MIRWLRTMFGKRCETCGKKKPLGTAYCDWCWNNGIGRAYGEEDK